MKRLVRCIVALSVLTTLLTGCYGKFALTRKVYQINGQVSDKYLRSAVTWAFIIVPVYGVASFLDFVLFNTIEFWSGKNPVAQGEKDFHYAEGDRRFDIHAVKEENRLSYRILQYQNGHFVDQVDIVWDLGSKGSRVVHRNYDRVEIMTAALKGDGVEVTTEGSFSYQRPEYVAAVVR